METKKKYILESSGLDVFVSSSVVEYGMIKADGRQRREGGKIDSKNCLKKVTIWVFNFTNSSNFSTIVYVRGEFDLCISMCLLAFLWFHLDFSL
ncbi:hypothetical protein P8452_77708 [Trifolium repens]|nr:hypothetical protein P8452_77708 [Trifolium repens]